MQSPGDERYTVQKLSLSPSWNWRSSEALVISPKPFRLRIEPSELNCKLLTLFPGLPNFGVLVKLNDSRRNSSFAFSPTWKFRNSPKSQVAQPCPRNRLKPAFPKRALLTAAKAVGSKYGWPGPTPPRILTSGFTKSARWVLKGAFSEEPEAKTENGRPLITLMVLLACHPPTILDRKPMLLSQGCPEPKGRLVLLAISRLCRRSKLLTDR